MFGRHSTTTVDERPVDDAVVDERTGAIEKPVTDLDTETERLMTRPDRTKGEPVVDETPVVEDKPAAVEPQRWAHVSFTATLSLVLGTVAIAATLTGLLAPLGFAAGVLAVILASASIVGVGRAHVTGHGVVLAGMLFGVVAVVLSLLAINGQLSWLSSKTDEIAVVHSWLNDHMHWLRRW